MMKDLRGSLWQRDNRTWTLQGEPAWNDETHRMIRPTIGTYKTRAEGKRAQVEYTAALNRGEFSVDAAVLYRTPLGDYLEDWLHVLELECQLGQIERRTFMDYESVTRIHLVPHLRSLTIGGINPAEIRKWLLAVRAKGVSERTVEKAYRTLHRALGDSGLAVNPVRLPKRHRPKGRSTTRREYPSPDVVRAFIDHLDRCEQAARQRAAIPLLVAAYSGLRRGEVCGLTWGDIDLEAATLTVEQTLQVGRGSELFVKGPKSEYGYRTIGLAPPVAAVLRQHRIETNRERLRSGGEQPSPFGLDVVFKSDPAGAPLHPDRLTAAMIREWNHAGCQPRTTLHGLRHAVGSALILAGLSITDVAAHLGDKPETVMAFYQHELDESKRRTAVNATIERLYG